MSTKKKKKPGGRTEHRCDFRALIGGEEEEEGRKEGLERFRVDDIPYPLYCVHAACMLGFKSSKRRWMSLIRGVVSEHMGFLEFENYT